MKATHLLVWGTVHRGENIGRFLTLDMDGNHNMLFLGMNTFIQE